jgi:glycosyltransferase involved in cell wall biosynthesis
VRSDLPTEPKVIVAQKGARENYLAARAFHRRGMLAALIVDWYAPFSGRLGKKAEKFLPGSMSRALRAPTNDLPRHLIKALHGTRLRSEIRSRFSKSKSLGEQFLRSNQGFASSVARRKWPKHDVFFGYSYASLEALEIERAAGKFCVLDQIDPGEKEHEIIIDEQRKWPTYAHSVSNVCRPYFERLQREWEMADVIIVNSEWSRDCNVEKGAPPEKMEILPLAYEAEKTRLTVKSVESELVEILWMGRVTLQKGIQYLVEAARLLQREPVKFTICGESAISRQAITDAPPNIRWFGKVTHSQKLHLFSTATAFVLPTLSDGFAITQLEAFAHGLPVIVTPNCGRVVEDGKTGFIIQACDPRSLAEAIMRFVCNRKLSCEMSSRCVQASKSYSIDAYETKLMSIIKKRMAYRTP